MTVSALKKLDEKAKRNVEKKEEDKKKPEEKNEIRKGTKKSVKTGATPPKKTTQKPKATQPKKTTPKTKATTTKKTTPNKSNTKHPGGRTNTRGKSGKDYKMVNVAVPVEIYEKVKAASNGNMTYYINAVLKKSVENVVKRGKK